MTRLPTPGSDTGQWGSILNDFLSKAHDGSGSLKNGIVTSDHIQDSSISVAKLNSAVQTSLSKADGSLQAANNLGDVTAAAARINLGLGSASTMTPAALAGDSAFTGVYIAKSWLSPLSRVVVLGDSTDYGSDNPNNTAGTSRGSSWPMFCELATSQQFHYIRNAGLPGNTTTQMVARFTTDVATHSPTAVTFGSARNDINADVALSTYQANIAALVSACRSIGALPILRTTTPTTATHGQVTRTWNSWLKAYAIANGLVVIDMYAAVVDAATGNFAAAMNAGDDVHPSQAGYAAMGNRAASDLAGLLRPTLIPTLLDAVDTNNVLQASSSDPLWLTGTVGVNKDPGNGWSIVNSSSVASAELDDTDATIRGKWYKMNFSSSVSDVTLYHPSPGIAVTQGHVYAYTGLCDINLSAAATQGANIQLGNSGTAYAVYGALTARHRGRFWCKFTAAGTGVNVQVYVKAGSTGSVSIAELALFDLTAMGIADLV